MPELPDIDLYIDALESRILNATLIELKLGNPFLLRTVAPDASAFKNKKVVALQRIGKRIALAFDNETGEREQQQGEQRENRHWLVMHLMIAGRLQWVDAGKARPARKSLLTLEFSSGFLSLTEAGSKRRASLHLFATEKDMRSIDRGGLEVFEINEAQFKERLTLRNHTLKRALTDQSLFSGIGNAYSDEILHNAGLSPILQSQKMNDDQITRLYKSCNSVLDHWKQALRKETGDKFPKKVTAFKEQMAVHGKFGQPCPVCETKVQRIRYANNETNYCPRCQTNNKLLADRSLSRLLKSDWPKTIEALEETDPVAKNPQSKPD